MKIYIASKLENFEHVQALRDSLRTLGHVITYDWTVHGPVYRSGLERVREVAEAETLGVLNADLVIVLWPGGRGTHVEFGIALGAGIPIIFVSGDERHHQATTETCAFYHHPRVTRAYTLPEALLEVERRKVASPRLSAADIDRASAEVSAERAHADR
jgi:nucleoside 2-deoxyribosyltransferase